MSIARQFLLVFGTNFFPLTFLVFDVPIGEARTNETARPPPQADGSNAEV